MRKQGFFWPEEISARVMEWIVYKIGDFSKLAQVSVKTLRHYGALGLLKPAWIDRYTGYRYYTAEQLQRLNRILALKDLGFSLEQINLLLRDNLSLEELRGMMRLKQAELESKIQVEQDRLKRVAMRLEQIEVQGSMPAYEVVMKAVPPQQVIGIRRLIPEYRFLSKLFDELHAHLRSHDLITDAGSPDIAIYYEHEYRKNDIDVEIAIPFTRKISGIQPYVIHELPGVETMACAIYQGNHELIGDVYRSMMAWVESHGFQVSGSNRELYHQPEQLQDGQEWPVTEIQLPVCEAPKSYFVSEDLESISMQPKIVNKPAFTVVGMVYDGKNENNEIAELWNQFAPNISEIRDISGASYGICNPAREDGSFRYLAGMEVSSAESTPPGMESWDVPAQQYAVFPCTLPTIGETYKYAFESWLPGSGYTYVQAPDFEFYDDDFDPQVPDSRLYIYIPIT